MVLPTPKRHCRGRPIDPSTPYPKALDTSKGGPIVEVKELVGGYMILTAARLEEAISVASECPGLLDPGSGFEVIEIQTP